MIVNQNTLQVSVNTERQKKVYKILSHGTIPTIFYSATGKTLLRPMGAYRNILYERLNQKMKSA